MFALVFLGAVDEGVASAGKESMKEMGKGISSWGRKRDLVMNHDGKETLSINIALELCIFSSLSDNCFAT